MVHSCSVKGKLEIHKNYQNNPFIRLRSYEIFGAGIKIHFEKRFTDGEIAGLPK